MDLAVISFRQIIMMVILMTIGIFCAKTKLIDQDTNKKLSSFILLLVNPLVIFMSYQRAFDERLLQGLLVSLGLAIISYTISLVVTHAIYRNKGDNKFAVEKYASVYSNSGFIGIPLVQGVFGSEGVFYLTAYLTIFNLLVWTHGVIVMSGKRDFSSIRKALVSPALLATILGFISFITRLELPELLGNSLHMLGNTNTPLAMIVAGISISQTDIGKSVKNKQVYKLCFVRLVLIPLLVILAFAPLDLPAILTGTSIIAVACPVAANIILFAYRYEQNHLYASELFAASTLLSMITIPLLLLFI